MADRHPRIRRRTAVWLAVGAALAAALGGVVFLFQGRRTAPETIDPHYPPVVAGTPGWDYQETAAADLDGDGTRERVVVLARAAFTGNPPPDDFGWDDGQPWHVYVEEPDGRRTYVYSRWVQLGRLEVWVAAEGTRRGLAILAREGAGLTLYRVDYRGPGKFRAHRLLSLEVLERTRLVPPAGP